MPWILLKPLLILPERQETDSNVICLEFINYFIDCNSQCCSDFIQFQEKLKISKYGLQKMHRNAFRYAHRARQGKEIQDSVKINSIK